MKEQFGSVDSCEPLDATWMARRASSTSKNDALFIFSLKHRAAIGLTACYHRTALPSTASHLHAPPLAIRLTSWYYSSVLLISYTIAIAIWVSDLSKKKFAGGKEEDDRDATPVSILWWQGAHDLSYECWVWNADCQKKWIVPAMAGGSTAVGGG